jgi:allantoin racemase
MEGNFESYLAAIAVMDRVMSYDQPFDAVIQAGYGEHGREGLQELLNVPVVDITDAAASTAMFLGHAYSVVTTLDRTVPLIEDRLKLSGSGIAVHRCGPAVWRYWNWSTNRNAHWKPSCIRPNWR